MSYLNGGGGNRTPVRKRCQIVLYARSQLYLSRLLSCRAAGQRESQPLFFKSTLKGVGPIEPSCATPQPTRKGGRQVERVAYFLGSHGIIVFAIYMCLPDVLRVIRQPRHANNPSPIPSKPFHPRISCDLAFGLPYSNFLPL